MPQTLQLAGGRQVTYEALGSGDPLLFFQGGPGLPTALLLPDAQLLADRFTIYLIDPHGTGGSTPPVNPEDYDPQGHARFYDEVRQALGLGPVTLLGFSFGGGVALAFAALFPEATRCCITVGAFAVGVEHVAEQAEAQMVRALERHVSAPWNAEAREVWDHWTERVLATDEPAELTAMFGTVLPLYFAHPERADVAAYIASFRGSGLTMDLRAGKAWEGGLYQRADLRHLFGDIHCPLLVTAGDLDPIGGLPQAEAIFRGLPQAHLAILPDCGHFVTAEAPALFRTLVLDWLARG